METHTSAQGEPSTANTGQTEGRHFLAKRLGNLARQLQRDDDPEHLLHAMVSAAIELIPGVEEGSISVVMARRRVESRAPSSELAKHMDALQSELGEGPCLEAIYEHQTVRVTDMSTESRWPRFAERAFAAGTGSMLCFQLYVEGDNLGALNLYASHVHAFTDESEHVGLLVASHAAVAYAEAQKTGQLNEALETRDLIGQAKGIIMERYKVTGQQAFVILTRASSESNIRLKAVAEQLVNSGELPGCKGR